MNCILTVKFENSEKLFAANIKACGVSDAQNKAEIVAESFNRSPFNLYGKVKETHIYFNKDWDMLDFITVPKNSYKLGGGVFRDYSYMTILNAITGQN